jgi:hypothetical protein
MGRPRNFLLALLVAVCAVSLWLARGDSPSLREDALPEDHGAPSVQEAALPPAHLRVLNSTGEAGLAAEAALLLPGLGCVVEGVGNAPGWGGSPSVLINRRLSDDRAAMLARKLGEISVIREWDGRTTEDAVLVLGADHARLLARLKEVAP